ncbi:MAG: DUF427 domain-containing protein [Acidobacteriaceae bacterium]|nr:DUF427 domain-containing protein [Acidobacteriaceae bacterium]
MKRIEPGPGQESVWDYPRPPRLEMSSRRIRVFFADTLIAESTKAYRVLETSHPPTWYIPREDTKAEFLISGKGSSHCEWKGVATYWTVKVGDQVAENAGWSYEHPSTRFTAIARHLAFYPSRCECYVDEERVQPQPGDFYGGWITSDVVGPFKGSPGTWGW